MPRSQAEVRWAHGVDEGDIPADEKDKSYAREVLGKMHGKSLKALPEHATQTPARKTLSKLK